MQIAKINRRNTRRFSKLTRCNAPCPHPTLHCSKFPCARHPEDVQREGEIYWHEHSPGQCLLSVLDLAQMQNQHRWRADANWDPWKHRHPGHAALDCREPHRAPACATFLGDFMCSQAFWGYWVKRPVLRDGTRSQKSAQLITTITRQQSHFYSKKRDLPWPKFILSQALQEQSSPSFAPSSEEETQHHPHFCLLSAYQGFHISWRLFFWAKFETQQ